MIWLILGLVGGFFARPLIQRLAYTYQWSVDIGTWERGISFKCSWCKGVEKYVLPMNFRGLSGSLALFSARHQKCCGTWLEGLRK